MTPTLSGDETKRSSLLWLVDFAGFPQRVPHCASIEALSTRAIENDLLPPRYEIDGLGKRTHRLRWDHHCAMHVGVDHVIMAHKHARDVYVTLHLNHVNMRMAWPDAAANDLKAGGQHVDIAKRAVGYATRHAEGGMDSRLHLAPERAEPGRSSTSWMTAMVGRPPAAT